MSRERKPTMALNTIRNNQNRPAPVWCKRFARPHQKVKAGDYVVSGHVAMRVLTVTGDYALCHRQNAGYNMLVPVNSLTVL